MDNQSLTNAYIENMVDQYMEQYRREMIEFSGSIIHNKVPVKEISLALTNRCNCHCVMCQVVSEETKKTGILNEVGHTVTLEEIKKILQKRVGEHTGEGIVFSFMAGETLLNPEVFEIFMYIKGQYPLSRIFLLTNGTIPPRNRDIVKFIDKLSFSIDAGSPSVYESIRTPAKFERMVKSVSEWLDAMNEFNCKIELGTSTTLSTLNIKDFPNLIRFLGEISSKYGRKFESMWVQPVVIQDYQEEWLREITLDHVPTKEGYDAINEALEVASQYDIRLPLPESLYALFDEEKKVYSLEEMHKMQCFCKKLNEGTLVYDADGKYKYICCYMRREKDREVLEQYGLDMDTTGDDMYNSENFWKLRRALLEGKMSDACANCMMGCSDYFTVRNQIKKFVMQDIIKKYS